MKKLVAVLCFSMLLLVACSSPQKEVKEAPPGFTNFILNEPVTLEGAKVEFRLSSDGRTLNSYISTTPTTNRRYFIELFSEEKQLLQPRMEKTSKANLTLDFNKINKSNVEQVRFFTYKAE